MPRKANGLNAESEKNRSSFASKQIIGLSDSDAEPSHENATQTEKTQPKRMQPEELSNEQSGFFNRANLQSNWKRRLLYPAAGTALAALLVIGVMAGNNWLPHTDALSGKRTGWFGTEIKASDALSFPNAAAAAITTTSTPQLSKEYIYAGSRMLAIEDAGAGSVQPPQTQRTNYALAANGSVATASSFDPNYPPSNIINGDRPGTNIGVWISGVGMPQWLEVNFGQTRTIDEVDVFTVQDNYQSPVEPTLSTTFTSTHANTAFEVQYWNGSAWVNVAAPVTGNNKVWRQFTFAATTTTKIRVNVTASAGDNYAYLTEVEAWGSTAAPRTNVALASNGAVATASSYHSAGYAPDGAINGERRGSVWGQNAGWNDASWGSFPDWLEVDFNGSKTIDEIDVFSFQDNYTNPIEPTETQTFSNSGLTNFDLQYWNGSGWATVPNGSVTGNNKVWRKLSFSPLTTTKIRIVVNGAADGYSRIPELEAWSGASAIFTPTPDPVTGCPSGFSSLGGVIVSDPTASVFNNKLYVFAIGTDGTVYYQYSDGSSFSGWNGLAGGYVVGNPASSVSATNLFVEASGTDNNRYYRTTSDGYGFSGWMPGTVNAQTNSTTVFNNSTYTFVKGTGSQPQLCAKVQ